MSNHWASLGRLQFASHAREQLWQWCELLGLQEPELCPPHWPSAGLGTEGPSSCGFFVLPSGSSLTLAQQYQLQTWLWELGRSESPTPSFHGGLQTPRNFLWANPGCWTSRCSCGLSSSPRFPFAAKQTEDKKITCRDAAVKQKSKLLLWQCNSCDRGTKTWGLEHMISLRCCSCAASDTVKENLILWVGFEVTVKASLGMREYWKPSSCLLMHRLTS